MSLYETYAISQLQYVIAILFMGYIYKGMLEG